jgi:hypothetical protein
MSSTGFSLSFRDSVEEFCKAPKSKTSEAEISKYSEPLDADMIFPGLSKLYSNSDLKPLIVKILDSDTLRPHLKYYATLFPGHSYTKGLLFPDFGAVSEDKNLVKDPETILAMGHSATRQQSTIAIKRCQNYFMLKAFLASQLRPPSRRDLFLNQKEKPKEQSEKVEIQTLPDKRSMSNEQITPSESKTLKPSVEVKSPPPKSRSNADEDLINNIIFEK